MLIIMWAMLINEDDFGSQRYKIIPENSQPLKTRNATGSTKRRFGHHLVGPPVPTDLSAGVGFGGSWVSLTVAPRSTVADSSGIVDQATE
jgi:hypothetical protein